MSETVNQTHETLETPFLGEAEFRAALDQAIKAATREIRIFDNNLERMMLNESARADALAAFLAESPTRRLSIVVHQSDYAETRCPRLNTLIRRYPNAVEVRETSDELKHLGDCFLLADQTHGVIRFHRDHARGKLLQNTADEIRPWWQRFDELWRSSTPCLAPTRLGL